MHFIRDTWSATDGIVLTRMYPGTGYMSPVDTGLTMYLNERNNDDDVQMLFIQGYVVSLKLTPPTKVPIRWRPHRQTHTTCARG